MPAPKHPNLLLAVQIVGLVCSVAAAFSLGGWKLGVIVFTAAGFLYDVRPTTTVYASYMQGLEAGATSPFNAANYRSLSCA